MKTSPLSSLAFVLECFEYIYHHNYLPKIPKQDKLTSYLILPDNMSLHACVCVRRGLSAAKYAPIKKYNLCEFIKIVTSTSLLR